MDELSDEVRGLILTQGYLLADPHAPVEPLPEGASVLTRETLEAAFTQLLVPPRMDPMLARQEMALVRWLDEQQPGTAEKLLRRMYGEAGDEDV